MGLHYIIVFTSIYRFCTLTTRTPLIQGGGGSPPLIKGWNVKDIVKEEVLDTTHLVKGVNIHPLIKVVWVVRAIHFTLQKWFPISYVRISTSIQERTRVHFLNVHLVRCQFAGLLSDSEIHTPPPRNRRSKSQVQNWGWCVFCLFLSFRQFAHHPPKKST